MRRPAIRSLALAASAVLLVLLAVQLVVPEVVERRVEDRLERDGGEVDVDIDAVPAVKLLWGRGDSIRIEGAGISAEPLGEARETLRRLDRFAEAHVRLTNLAGGPVDTRLFELGRDSRDEPYRLRIAGGVVPGDLARYAGSRFGPLGAMLGGIAADQIPLGEQELPLDVDAQVESRDGRPEVVSGGGTLAGVPLGPLAQAVLEAIAARI